MFFLPCLSLHELLGANEADCICYVLEKKVLCHILKHDITYPYLASLQVQ